MQRQTSYIGELSAVQNVLVKLESIAKAKGATTPVEHLTKNDIKALKLEYNTWSTFSRANFKYIHPIARLLVDSLTVQAHEGESDFASEPEIEAYYTALRDLYLRLGSTSSIQCANSMNANVLLFFMIGPQKRQEARLDKAVAELEQEFRTLVRNHIKKARLVNFQWKLIKNEVSAKFTRMVCMKMMKADAFHEVEDKSLEFESIRESFQEMLSAFDLEVAAEVE